MVTNGVRVVAVGREGRVTLPAEMREALDLGEGTQILIEIDQTRGTLLLKPAVTVPRDPAWVSGDEHLARLEQSYADAQAGRVMRMSDELAKKLLDGSENGP